MKTTKWIGRMGLLGCLASTGCALGSGADDADTQSLGCDADHPVHEPDETAPSALPMISDADMQKAEANLEEVLSEWDMKHDDGLSVDGLPLVRFELSAGQTLPDAAAALEKARDLAVVPEPVAPTHARRVTFMCAGAGQWLVCCSINFCNINTPGGGSAVFTNLLM